MTSKNKKTSDDSALKSRPPKAAAQTTSHPNNALKHAAQTMSSNSNSNQNNNNNNNNNFQDSSSHNEQAKILIKNLISAASEGKVDLCRLLIRCGANINGQDEQSGNTALHQAAWCGFSETVRLLCKHGANTLIKNKSQFTGLHVAALNGHNECARLLLMANRRLAEQKNSNLDTPLHIAAAMGRRKLTRILMQCGAIPSIKNKQDETPMDIALRKDLIEIQETIANPPPEKTARASHQQHRSQLLAGRRHQHQHHRASGEPADEPELEAELADHDHQINNDYQRDFQLYQNNSASHRSPVDQHQHQQHRAASRQPRNYRRGVPGSNQYLIGGGQHANKLGKHVSQPELPSIEQLSQLELRYSSRLEVNGLGSGSNHSNGPASTSNNNNLTIAGPKQRAMGASRELAVDVPSQPRRPAPAGYCSPLGRRTLPDARPDARAMLEGRVELAAGGTCQAAVEPNKQTSMDVIIRAPASSPLANGEQAATNGARVNKSSRCGGASRISTRLSMKGGRSNRYKRLLQKSGLNPNKLSLVQLRFMTKKSRQSKRPMESDPAVASSTIVAVDNDAQGDNEDNDNDIDYVDADADADEPKKQKSLVKGRRFERQLALKRPNNNTANETGDQFATAPNGARLLVTKPLASLSDQTQLYAIPRKPKLLKQQVSSRARHEEEQEGSRDTPSELLSAPTTNQAEREQATDLGPSNLEGGRVCSGPTRDPNSTCPAEHGDADDEKCLSNVLRLASRLRLADEMETTNANNPAVNDPDDDANGHKPCRCPLNHGAPLKVLTQVASGGGGGGNGGQLNGAGAPESRPASDGGELESGPAGSHSCHSSGPAAPQASNSSSKFRQLFQLTGTGNAKGKLKPADEASQANQAKTNQDQQQQPKQETGAAAGSHQPLWPLNLERADPLSGVARRPSSLDQNERGVAQQATSCADSSSVSSQTKAPALQKSAKSTGWLRSKFYSSSSNLAAKQQEDSGKSINGIELEPSELAESDERRLLMRDEDVNSQLIRPKSALSSTSAQLLAAQKSLAAAAAAKVKRDRLFKLSTLTANSNSIKPKGAPNATYDLLSVRTDADEEDRGDQQQQQQVKSRASVNQGALQKFMIRKQDHASSAAGIPGVSSSVAGLMSKLTSHAINRDQHQHQNGTSISHHDGNSVGMTSESSPSNNGADSDNSLHASGGSGSQSSSTGAMVASHLHHAHSTPSPIIQHHHHQGILSRMMIGSSGGGNNLIQKSGGLSDPLVCVHPNSINSSNNSSSNSPPSLAGSLASPASSTTKNKCVGGAAGSQLMLGPSRSRQPIVERPEPEFCDISNDSNELTLTSGETTHPPADPPRLPPKGVLKKGFNPIFLHADQQQQQQHYQNHRQQMALASNFAPNHSVAVSNGLPYSNGVSMVNGLCDYHRDPCNQPMIRVPPSSSSYQNHYHLQNSRPTFLSNNNTHTRTYQPSIIDLEQKQAAQLYHMDPFAGDSAYLPYQQQQQQQNGYQEHHYMSSGPSINYPSYQTTTNAIYSHDDSIYIPPRPLAGRLEPASSGLQVMSSSFSNMLINRPKSSMERREYNQNEDNIYGQNNNSRLFGGIHRGQAQLQQTTSVANLSSKQTWARNLEQQQVREQHDNSTSSSSTIKSSELTVKTGDQIVSPSSNSDNKQHRYKSLIQVNQTPSSDAGADANKTILTNGATKTRLLIKTPHSAITQTNGHSDSSAVSRNEPSDIADSQQSTPNSNATYLDHLNSETSTIL